VLSALGGEVLPAPVDLLLIIAVLTSAWASTQTTIPPTTRTGLSTARAIYERRGQRKSTRNLVALGILPFTGGLLLVGIFVKALVVYGGPASTSSSGVLGIGAPVVIGIGSMLLGVVVMLATRPQRRAFFHRRTEVADAAVLAESAA
jgi:hypothetical protein